MLIKNDIISGTTAVQEYLFTANAQVFQPWKVPTGIEFIWVTLVGAGGASKNTESGGLVSGGGGGGEVVLNYPIAVTPGETFMFMVGYSSSTNSNADTYFYNARVSNFSLANTPSAIIRSALGGRNSIVAAASNTVSNGGTGGGSSGGAGGPVGSNMDGITGGTTSVTGTSQILIRSSYMRWLSNLLASRNMVSNLTSYSVYGGGGGGASAAYNSNSFPLALSPTADTGRGGNHIPNGGVPGKWSAGSFGMGGAGGQAGLVIPDVGYGLIRGTNGLSGNQGRAGEGGYGYGAGAGGCVGTSGIANTPILGAPGLVIISYYPIS